MVLSLYLAGRGQQVSNRVFLLFIDLVVLVLPLAPLSYIARLFRTVLVVVELLSRLRFFS